MSRPMGVPASPRFRTELSPASLVFAELRDAWVGDYGVSVQMIEDAIEISDKPDAKRCRVLSQLRRQTGALGWRLELGDDGEWRLHPGRTAKVVRVGGVVS